MAYHPNEENKGYAQGIPVPMSPVPAYHQQSPPQSKVDGIYPNNAPAPLQTPPMAHQQEPDQGTTYQQQSNGMNYQHQQPGMNMQYPPDQQAIMYQQQMYGQSPPYPHQGGPDQPQQKDGGQFLTAVPIPNLSMGPAPVDCPSCGKRALTRVSYHVGNTNHIWALIAFCFTLCLFFIPYMMNSLKDVQHNCGKCGVLLAVWHKSGAVDVHMHA